MLMALMEHGSAERALEAGHPAGAKLVVQTWFGETGARLAAGDEAPAAACYDVAGRGRRGHPAMMPVSKHGDPQLGIDIHLCVVPPGVPTPLPTPHISVVFDPFDYLPFIGATVTVCGMKRATAGTNGMSVHIPTGFPFAKPPDKDDELFMGSSTVLADGERSRTSRCRC